MEMTYVCSPLSAPTRAERLANAAKATTYMIWAEKEFGGRAVAPHAYLPYLLDDSVPEQRALALDFGLKLLGMCSRLVAFGDRLSAGMKKEIEVAHEKGIPVFYRTGICAESRPAVKRTPVIVGRPINGITLNGLEYNKGMDLDFVDIGFELSKQYTVMITPAKWQTAEADQRVMSEMTYGEFRKKIVPHMSHVVFFPCCKDVFDIYQTDGITYYVLDKEEHSTCVVENRCKDIAPFNSRETRPITNAESLLNIGNEIIEYMGAYPKFQFMYLTGNKRFEVWMNTKVSGYDWYATKNPRYVLSISRLIDNSKGQRYDGEAKCIFESDSRDECESFGTWIYSKFTRFFLVPNISKLNNIQTNHCFRFVPAPPSGKFDHIYTDAELYKAFNLPQKYIDVIEAVIKERK